MFDPSERTGLQAWVLLLVRQSDILPRWLTTGYPGFCYFKIEFMLLLLTSSQAKPGPFLTRDGSSAGLIVFGVYMTGVAGNYGSCSAVGDSGRLNAFCSSGLHYLYQTHPQVRYSFITHLLISLDSPSEQFVLHISSYPISCYSEDFCKKKSGNDVFSNQLLISELLDTKITVDTLYEAIVHTEAIWFFSPINIPLFRRKTHPPLIGMMFH